MAKSNLAGLGGELSAEEQQALHDNQAGDAADIAAAEQQEVAEQTDKDAQTVGDKRQKMVPHAALHEEREGRKADKAAREAAEDRARKAEENFATLATRTQQILDRYVNQPTGEAADQIKPKPEPIPDVNSDPLGHILGTIAAGNAEREALKAEIESLKGAGTQQTENQRRAQLIGQVQQVAIGMEGEFKKTTADYDAATAFLRGTRDAELAELGYQPAERGQIIAQEAFGIAARAMLQNKNPAAVLYAIAKQRGYVAATTKPANGDGTNGTQVSDADKLRSAQRGQEQARSLSSTRGGAAPPMTAARLLEMSPDEFLRAVNTKAGRELMGA